MCLLFPISLCPEPAPSPTLLADLQIPECRRIADMYVHKLQLHTAVHEPQIEATVRP